jgi:hypothetical protein
MPLILFGCPSCLLCCQSFVVGIHKPAPSVVSRHVHKCMNFVQVHCHQLHHHPAFHYTHKRANFMQVNTCESHHHPVSHHIRIHMNFVQVHLTDACELKLDQLLRLARFLSTHLGMVQVQIGGGLVANYPSKPISVLISFKMKIWLARSCVEYIYLHFLANTFSNFQTVQEKIGFLANCHSCHSLVM